MAALFSCQKQRNVKNVISKVMMYKKSEFVIPKYLLISVVFLLFLILWSNFFRGFQTWLPLKNFQNVVESTGIGIGLLGLRNPAQASPFIPYHGDTSLARRIRHHVPINADVKKEAVAALHIALELKEQNKNEKALKVLQHAIKLDPFHADILIAYGELVEQHESDIVTADMMYNRALIVSPKHKQALENTERTKPIVEEIDQKRFNRIDKKRDRLYKVPSNHPGLRRMKQEAYFSHIYHTNAIEGNTLTLSQTRSIVETRIAIGGKSLAEQNEVLGLDAALRFVNSTLLGAIGQLTVDNLLEIHRRVLGFVDPTEAGRYRKTQVFVGDFTPPPPEDLDILMDQFLEWLNSEETLSLHPIELAALAHYKLVIIHPFYDGNGRTSRLLMNLILMQAGFPPVSIEVQDRQRYYEFIDTANNGDIRPFIRFIAECTERTVDQFLISTLESSSLQVLNKTNRDRVIVLNSEEDDL
ncbi:hypothetical protein LOTGIDRAFT_163109 [Lottia gigantea]|uniref:protein adenylyltransferase n=1 Tax=Lottia gigantea TaxID=225164 RepID=V4A4V8_LOTGI|nr:hypothetical protein LOTGIDRAFT_163109 [Lottia gigantea]ESO91747.1 hypothetical protein LOTGIDRAFT_163109 [Lottia gigantea]